MRTFNFNDINEDLIFLFTLCYDNNLNFNRLYTLYTLSSKVFWGYIGALAPIFKVGAKKVNTYSDTAYNIMRFINKTPYAELNTFDEKIYNLLRLFISNIYISDDLTNIKLQKDFIGKETLCRYKGEDKYKTLVIHDNTDLSNVIEVKLDDNNYYKSSRIETIIDKYYGNLKVSEVNSKTLKEYEDMVLDVKKEKAVNNG